MWLARMEWFRNSCVLVPTQKHPAQCECAPDSAAPPLACGVSFELTSSSHVVINER